MMTCFWMIYSPLHPRYYFKYHTIINRIGSRVVELRVMLYLLRCLWLIQPMIYPFILYQRHKLLYTEFDPVVFPLCKIILLSDISVVMLCYIPSPLHRLHCRNTNALISTSTHARIKLHIIHNLLPLLLR